MKGVIFFHCSTFAKMKKKFFQINVEKNGPIAGPEMESCLRQCTVCPDADSSHAMKYALLHRCPSFLVYNTRSSIIPSVIVPSSRIKVSNCL